MARSLWTGSISFGLVNVPVALYSAVRDLDVHFRQLHGKDGAPIETRRFCSKEDKEVPFEAIGHGYEEDGEDLVVLTDEDLAAAAPRKTRTIDIEAFVDVADVDPLFFDHPYYLAPVGEAEGNLRAYRLLVKVLASTDRAALGRFVLRSKEYLVLVRVRDDRLALTTMLFHDEVRPAKGIDTRRAQAGEGPARRGDEADRGAQRRLGPGALPRLLPRAAAGRHRAQAQGAEDHGAVVEPRRRRAAAGHHGRAEGVARAGAGGGGVRPGRATMPATATASRTSRATSSTSARRRRTSRGGRR